ncbi:MAG TPA: hypothetical protein ENG87_02825 [Candidatus Pacearchaeota archaeon]|nr:hypothetical protein [Candidatus Pacearchaeota archaeon]
MTQKEKEALLKQEKEAILKSIRHWIEDIYMPLCIPGMRIEIDKDRRYFIMDKIVKWREESTHELKELIPDIDHNCPLCEFSALMSYRFNIIYTCFCCPYYFKYRKACIEHSYNYLANGQHYWEWYRNPCLATAADMISALENLLPENERDGVYGKKQ